MVDCVHVQHLGLPFNSEICFNDSSMTCIFLPRLLFSFCHDTVHRKAEEEEPGKEATFMHMHGELTLLSLESIFHRPRRLVCSANCGEVSLPELLLQTLHAQSNGSPHGPDGW